MGVATYRLYVNGVLLTNVPASVLSYAFNFDGHTAVDLRIQAVDATGNASPVQPLAFLPGDTIAAVSDDSARLFFFEYYQTNAFQTNSGFGPRVQLPSLNYGARGLGIGDFDRDGVLDIIAGGVSGDTLTPYFIRGKADGTFYPAVPLPTLSGANGYMMDGTVGDFDGDGNLDFVCGGNNRYEFYYWGNGDGSFTPMVRDLADGNYYYGRGTAAGDFNEDGREDFARAAYSGGLIRIFTSNGDRTFVETNAFLRAGDDPYGLAAGDFDEDGHLDLIEIGGGNGDVTFFQGLGDGTFTNLGIAGSWTNLDINTYAAIDAYDYDGDGHLDVVISGYNGQVYFGHGNGDGSFSNLVAITTGISGALGVSAPPRPARVDVHISPTDPATNLNGTLTFTALGTGVKTNDYFLWSFGDVNTNPVAWTFDTNAASMGRTISHSYTNEGRYLTRLFYRNAQGIPSVRGTWATIKADPPVADPGGPYAYGEEVVTQAVWYATLNGAASTDDYGIISYLWSFGDGTVASNTLPTISHSWTNPGPWTVTLTVMDAARQTDTKSTTVTFTPGNPPVAAIDGPDVVDETFAHNGTWSTTFYSTNSTDDFGIWKYFWNFGNGQTSTSPTGNTTYNAVGTYTVSLTVTDNAGQTNQTTHQVTIKANNPPVPVINGPHLLTVSVATNGLWYGAWDGLASTDDTGIYQYNWKFGDGATATGSQVTHQYAAAGLYPLALTVTDNGNQSVTVTQTVIVVAGSPPVAKITASTLSPEGRQPVTLSGATSTSDNGIYLYEWFLPPQQFDLTGQQIDVNQWQSANATQNDKFNLSGNNNWGASYFYSIGTLLARGGSMECRVDTSSTANSHAMVGLKNLNFNSGNYNQLVYAVYFADGSVRIYENGGDRGAVTNYDKGTSYDVRVESKPGAGARYYLRPSGTGQAYALIYESANYSDALLSFGADVYGGVWNFDNFAVDQVVAPYRDITRQIYPGGTVTLQVVDSGLLTNSTSVVITPVTGTPPTAVINGPTNGPSGVELAFDGYGSGDDHGIASYVWDFGDGTPLGYGAAVSHRYSLAGTYTNKLTVMDYASQAASASLVITITGSNSLVCVPWLIINGIEQAHITYSGRTNTVKAVAHDIDVPFDYVWDFGDGTGTVTNSVTNSAAVYNLEATHVYAGADGTPYYATVKAYLTNGMVLSDTYPLIIQSKTLENEEKVSIDEGLWYLQKTQNRYDFDANTKGGDWTGSGYKINATASSVQAFAINGHVMTDDASRDPYVDTVRRGVNYLLNALNPINIGMQAYGDPDGNHNGIGLQANSGRPIYETGPVMDALVSAGRPELVASTGGVNVKGRQFRDIMQDMVDMYCWGQCDIDYLGGGWRYSWNDGPDNSASQWGAIGMLAAENYWGLTIPDWIKSRNITWLKYSRDSYGYGYAGPGGAGYATGGDEASTPSALIQASFDGITSTNDMWIAGASYLAKYWTQIMGLDNVYANYSIAKSMRVAVPQAVHNLPVTGKDWFLDPADGLARVTIDLQQTNGSWGSRYWVDSGLATPWSILILSSSLFQQGPVAVVNVTPNPSAIGYPVVFDARNSYHRHPGYSIVEYRWIFDSSKGLDFEHPDAIGPVVTNIYGDFSTNTVTLQVRDNNDPPLLDTASVVVQTTVPPYPPTADTGGPYVACVGQDVHLDGSGSFCVDASSGNFIRSWDWEVNYQVPVTFDQGVSGERAVITNGYSVSGAHQIGLRVINANSIVYPGFGLDDATNDAFTFVYVYDRVINDLKVRAKDNKAQLTWTKTGDYAVIMRSSVGPDRGYTEVGRTTSAFATFLDTTINFNTEYYYRIFAYRNSQPDPIGVSDPVFIVSPPRSFDQHAPQFQSTPVRLAKVGQLYEVTLDAKDPENKQLYFAKLAGPTNLTVNLTNGVVDFLPLASQIGNQFVSFEVTNNIGRDVLSYTIFVFPATNHPPVVNLNGPYSGLTGQAIQFSSAGTSDPDGNSLFLFWNFGDGTTSTNPNPSHVYGGIGDYLVSLFANDGYGGTTSARTHVQITRPNRAPVAVVSNAPNFIIRLGETLNLNGAGSYDLDGDPITYTWNWGDGTTNANAASTAAHLYATTGVKNGGLTVADNRGGSNTATFKVTVQASNQPPHIVMSASTNSPFVMGTVTFDATGTTDPENDPLLYEWDFGDRAKTTGSLVTHVFQQIGDFTVTLKVSDNHGGVSTQTVVIHTLNAPPVFTSEPPLLVRAGKTYDYLPAVSDADGDPATFELVQGPATMNCDTNTGELTWLPGTNNLGPNPVVLRVTDSNGASAEQSFSLVVSTPLGPQLDLEPTHIIMTNVVADSGDLSLSGTVRVYLRNNGADPVPVPFTVSVFVDANGDGQFDTNNDWVVGGGVLPAGFLAGGEAWAEMSVHGAALFKDEPLSAFIDSQNVVPEYDEANNIRMAGFDANTNVPPVVDLTASYLQVDRSDLPTNVVLTARLGNSGYVAVATNVPVAFYDGDPRSGGVLLGVAHSLTNLLPGRFEDVSITWNAPVIAKHTVFVRADDPGTGVGLYNEISESNNLFSAEADLTANLPPVADAGPAVSVYVGDYAVLNGQNSHDPENKPLKYNWSLLSIPIGSHVALTNATTVQPYFQPDIAGPYTVKLVVNDGVQDSTNAASVVVTAVDTNANHYPSITSKPSFQSMVGVAYTYPVMATDPDNDPLQYTLAQAPAGMTINTNTGLIGWTPTNTGSFFIQVNVYDNRGLGVYQSYTLTVIAYTNLPPQFTSTPPQTGNPGAAYAYTATATDPNQDTITFALTQNPAGMSINGSSGQINWTPTVGQLGGNAVTITANDGHGGVATQSYNLVVLSGNGSNGPVVQPIPDQTVTAPASFATFALDNYVSDPSYPKDQLTWSVTGTNLLAVAIDANRVATVTYPSGANVAEQLTFLVQDPAGNSAYATPTFTVIGSSTPPVAAIANLSATDTTSIQTGSFNLLGTADAPGLPVPVAYRIGLYNGDGVRMADLTPAPINSGGWHEGRVPAGGSLGNLDFTMVRNGAYTLLLEVSANGQLASASAAIAVDSPLKIGQLTFAQQDLVLPVQGVGLAVNRTYDSLNPKSADFGYSWTYGVSDLGVNVGDQRVNQQDGFDGTPFSLRTGGSWDVTLTMPDTGRTVTFRFGLSQGFLKAQAGWTPPAWVHASLVPTCSATLFTLPGGIPPIWQAAGEGTDWQAFDWPGFVLTLQNGTKYVISREDIGDHFYASDSGFGGFVHAYGTPYVSQIIQPDGSKTDFIHNGTAAGLQNIVQYDPAGQRVKSILFQRDGQNRITGIYTPENLDTNGVPAGPASVTYAYDATGNLVAVGKLLDGSNPTNLVYANFQYFYTNPRFPHLLTQITDPRGLPIFQAVFDDSGRLIGTKDANGNLASIQHNMGARTETSFDRMGNPTQFGYDESGNVTSETDPLGNTSTYTYDSNNRRTSITDPLGHTTTFAFDANGNATQITDPLGHTNSFTATASGTPTSYTDPLGHTTTLNLDAAGRMTNAIDAMGNVTKQNYDAAGNMTDIIDPSGHTTAHLSYASGSVPSQISNVAGQSMTLGYDASGHVTSHQTQWVNPANSNDVRTVASYVGIDDAGRVTNSIDPLGRSLSKVYDQLNDVVQTTDFRGNTVSNSYNANGKLIESRDSAGLLIRTVYDANDREVVQMDAHLDGQNANGTQIIYDAAGRMVSTIRLSNVVVAVSSTTIGGVPILASYFASAGGVISSNYMAYDAASRLIAVTDTAGQTTRFEYDAAGRKTAVIDPLGHRTTMDYDAAGHNIAIHDPLGNETDFLYDANGRLSRTIYPNGAAVAKTYTATGQPDTKTDPLGNVSKVLYDDLGVGNGMMLPQINDPENGNNLTNPVFGVKFDANRNVQQMVDAKGRITAFTYDQFNRRTSRTLPLGQVEQMVYNAAGDLSRVIDFDGQAVGIQYDGQGRPIARNLYAAGTNSPAETATLKYDELGRVVEMDEPRGVTKLSYDLDNRVTRIAAPEGTINYDYDPATGWKTRTWTDNSDTRYTYDELGRLQTVTATKRNGQVLTSPEVTAYTYTAVGNRASTTLPNGIKTLYGYDEMNRLTSLQQIATNGAVLMSFAYQYNAANMRTNANEIVTGADGAVHTNNIAYTYDALNRLIGEAADDRGDGTGYQAGYVYDLVGNRLSRAVTTAGKTLTTYYTYDANDRLLMESNVVSTATAGNGMVPPHILGPGGRLLPASESQFAKLCYYMIPGAPVGLAVAFLVPAILSLFGRRGRRPAVLSLDLNPHRALLPRCVSGCLVALMILMGFDLRTVANEAVYYAAVTTDTWGLDGSVTTYQYDANGSVIQKVTTGPKPETDTFQYTLLKQLAVSTRTYTSGGSQVVETTKNTYDYDGIRVSSVSSLKLDGVTQSASTNYFLIDPSNLTGFAQVIEELPALGAAPSVSYTIGNDIIAQSSNPSGTAQYLLKDGHDSTRQLATSAGTVTDYYGYDSYGVMLGGNPTAASPAATKMLYSGEQFDANLGLYNQRARYYDPGLGRFTTMDSYEGSPQDPQSLHKYTYCTGDPVNYHDPSGHQDLAEVMVDVAIVGILVGIAIGSVSAWKGGSFSPDSALFGISASISGQGIGASSAVSIANSISSIFGAAASNAGTIGTNIYGLALGSLSTPALMLGNGLSFNVGKETLFTTGDRKVSGWYYFGPGLSISEGFTTALAASVNIYAGVCWGVPEFGKYAGGFYSFSLGAGSGLFGFAISFFISDSTPGQYGYSVGLTINIPQGEWGPVGFGFSYVDYKTNFNADWTSPYYACIVLGLVPGMQMWPPFISYKWATQQG
ncbi:MAG TPA: PKD domain-containing protein [Dongiaceae bacterium]|nr:PKD domain-containing protein [Dongiaceae bacterium]